MTTLPQQLRTWTCVHLSDIHFRTKNGTGEWFSNTDIREQLIEDIARLKEHGQHFDAILVSGDVAFSGQQREYDDALSFLSNACEKAGILPSEVWMVPGNHDVNRAALSFGKKNWHTQIKNPAVLVGERQRLLDQIVTLDERQKLRFPPRSVQSGCKESVPQPACFRRAYSLGERSSRELCGRTSL